MICSICFVLERWERERFLHWKQRKSPRSPSLWEKWMNELVMTGESFLLSLHCYQLIIIVAVLSARNTRRTHPLMSPIPLQLYPPTAFTTVAFLLINKGRIWMADKQVMQRITGLLLLYYLPMFEWATGSASHPLITICGSKNFCLERECKSF